MVRNEFPFRDAAINEHVFLVRINREKAEPSYVYHFLRSPLGQAAIMLDFRGATVGGISRGFVDKVMLPLPPLPEQRRIAAILDQAEALRAKRRAALAKLAALAQSVFLDMFGDPVRNSKDFPRELLGAVLSRPFQNGAYFPANRYCSDGGVEMVHMSDAFEGVVLRGALKRVDVNEQEKAKYALTQHDLIVARRSLNYLGSVKPCLIPAQTREPLIFESSLIRVTPNDNIVGVPYLYYYLSNTRVRERFVFPFVTQATISGINQQNLAQIQVLLPPRAAQEEFAKRIRELDALMAIHRASLTSFISLFAALQHRAFRGEL
jgi:type I restriction enzyme S subunit